MFYYPTFFIHQNFRTDLTCMWVLFKLKVFVLNPQKNWQRGRNTFLGFCDLNETLIFMSKFSMEAFLEINYEFVFQRKEGHIFSYHVPKQPKVLKKIYFWYFKVQVSKWTRIENFQILDFCETNRSVGAKPQKRCANFIEDSETFQRYGDVDTSAGRWSNWNDGVIIFSHYFLTNVVITG